MTRITTNVLRDISLFHAETAEDAEIPFAMDKCTANLCVTLRPLREKNLFLCTSVKILCKSVFSVCPQKNMSFCSSVKKICVIPCIPCAIIFDIRTNEQIAPRPLRLCVRQKYVLLFFCQKQISVSFRVLLSPHKFGQRLSVPCARK